MSNHAQIENVICFVVRFCLWCSTTSSSPYTKTFWVSPLTGPPNFQLLSFVNLLLIYRQDHQATECSWLYIFIYVCVFLMLIT